MIRLSISFLQMQAQQTNKQMPKTATSPGIIHKASNPHQGPVGTPIARPKPTPPRPTTPTSSNTPLTPKPKIIQEPEKKPQTFTPMAKHNNLPQMIAPPGKRDKLSFVIKSKGIASTLLSLKQGQGSVKQGPGSVKQAQGSVKQETKGNPLLDKGGASGPLRSDSSSISGKSPLKTKNNGDVAVATKKHKAPGLTKPKEEEKTTESPKKAIVVKKAPVVTKATVVTKVKKRSSLVPYDNDDDSSSSSDSDTNYDALVERLSKGAVKDTGASSSNGSKEVVKGDPDMKPPDAAALEREREKRSALASSINLTAIRKTDSPLKLTITTNGNAQRIMSTTPWKVTDGDEQVSPSVTSDSSNHSNQSSNSTREWAVNDKKDKQSVEEAVKKEASHVGWSVKPSPSRNGVGKFRPDNGDDRRTGSPTKPAPCKTKKDVTAGNGLKNRTPSFSEKSFVSKREKLGIVPKQLNGKHVNQDRTKPSVPDTQTDVQGSSGVGKEREKANGKSFLVHQQSDITKHGVDAQSSNGKKNSSDFKKDIASSSDDSDSGEEEVGKNNKSQPEVTLKQKKKKKKKFVSDAELPATSEANGQSDRKDASEKGMGVGKSEKLPESDAFRKYRGTGNDSDSDHGSNAAFKRKKNGQPAPGLHHQKFPPAPQRFQERFSSPTDSDYDEDSPVGHHNQGPRRKREYPGGEQGYYEERPHPPQQQGQDHRAHWYGAPLGNKRKKMVNGYDEGYGPKQDQRRFRQEGEICTSIE